LSKSVRSLSDVRTRNDLMKLLEEAMNTSAHALIEEQRLAAGTNLVKSFIIESNCRGPQELAQIRGKVSSRLHETDDSDLNYVEISRNKKRCPFLLDTSDERFWLFHTLERSEMSKWAIDGLVRSPMSRLDYVWLSRQFLTSFVADVEMSEFSAKFDSAIPENQYEKFISQMSIRVWGGASQRALRSLQETDLGYTVSLSAVRARFKLDNGYADERLTRRGLASASGTSAVVHMQTIDRVKQRYRKHVEEIEKESKSARSLRDVAPHYLTVPGGISDVRLFVERLSANMHSLRIFGVPFRIAPEFYSIPAIDLHNGD